MAREDDDQSVFREPHLRPDTKAPDPSEAKAERVLRGEESRSSKRYTDGQSVFDEPDVYPDRAAEVVDQDWSCSACGYNLRGLPTGHPCPECGHKELYRPATRDATSYQTWLRQRLAETSLSKGWTIAVLLALCGGPWAVLAALIHTNPGGVAGTSVVVMAVVFGPALEETMKIAAAACVVEVRPYLFRRVEQVQVAAVGAALLFAVIENIIYLNVYFPSHSLEFALWRWTVCVALHVGCTLIATRGLVRTWARTVTEYRPPDLAIGFRPLVAAIVIHACYNAGATVYELIAK